jgi:hypothetical protein
MVPQSRHGSMRRPAFHDIGFISFRGDFTIAHVWRSDRDITSSFRRHWGREKSLRRSGLAIKVDRRCNYGALETLVRSIWSAKRASIRFNQAEQDVAEHAGFWWDLEPDDQLIYVNVPTDWECTLAEVIESYDFTDVWDPEKRGDLRHMVRCEYIGTFDRNCSAVAPELSKRLKLKRSHWKLIDYINEIAHIEALVRAAPTHRI